MKNAIVEFILHHILTPTVFIYMQLVAWTSHWRIIHKRRIDSIRTNKETVIFAFWHNQLVLMPCWYKKTLKNTPLSVLISRSKDGEYIRKVIEYFRLDAVRGSTSRGGEVGLKKLISKLKNGSMVAITPDGPKGPRYRVQMGVIKLAQTTGCKIVPIAYDSSLKLVLKTWDRLRIPLFMGNIYGIFGNHITVPQNASKETCEAKRQQLEDELNKINAEAVRRVAWWVGRRVKPAN